MANPTSINPVVAPAVGSVTGALVETYLKPHLQSLKRRGDKRKALDELTLFGGFERYLDRSYKRHSELTTLALQGKPRLLSDLYIPLTLIKSGRTTDEYHNTLLDCYPKDLLSQLKRVLIIDNAGMGKSTLVKFLFLQCVETQSGFPILIELRRLREDKDISDVIVDELCEVCPEISRSTMVDAVNDLLSQGEFVFLLDGYDEVPFNERERVALHLRDFINHVGHNQRNTFLVSSRPDPGVASLPSFHSFHIQPLEVEEAFELLRKYDKDGDLSEQLIAELQSQMGSVREFLDNPMLVSLLFEAYDYTRNIPLKKSSFYRQVYDAIFERHDATKPLFKREKHSNLDKDDFERVLRALGIRTLKEGIGYSHNQLLKNIADARQMCPGLTFKESDFLKDLLSTVPLFTREGDYHRWKHKSIQEYFAALYICNDLGSTEQAKALRQMARNNENYFQVLILCYDLNFRSFRNTLIYDLISQFISYYETTYTGIDRSLIDEELIHQRKLFCFGKIHIVCNEDDAEDLADRLSKHKGNLENIVGNLGMTHSWPSLKDNFIDSLDIREDFFGNSMELLCVYVAPESIIDMIVESKENFLVDVDDHYRDWRIFDQLNRDFVGMTQETLIMDDNPASFFNTPENFKKVNVLLNFMGGSCLAVERCRTLKAEIEADIERGNSASILSLL